MGRFFSRADGEYLDKLDPFFRFLPYIMKGRNASAVYFNQQIEITTLKNYLYERNKRIAQAGTGSMSTMFHAVLFAMLRTIYEREQLNRFIIGRRIYQRKYLSCAFIMKSEFKDDSNEEVIILPFNPDDTLDSVSGRIQKEVRAVRQQARQKDPSRHGAVNWLRFFMHAPRIVLRGIVRFLEFLDYHGWLPGALLRVDPMHSSIFISNLGSLDTDAPFHHLYEWGTTSIFLTIGVAGRQPVVQADGTLAVRDCLNLAITLDERIGDGFYFARSFHRFKELLENPSFLEMRLSDPTGPAIVPTDDVGL